MKAEIKIPMLSLGANQKKAPEKKETPKPEGGAIAPTWKPPTKKKMLNEAVHDEVRNSRRKWVAGDISTKQHKETMKRAAFALKMPSVGRSR